MNDTLKMYGSIGLEIMNRYFVVAMCFKCQPRWRRLQTINSLFPIFIIYCVKVQLFLLLIGQNISCDSEEIDCRSGNTFEQWTLLLFTSI